MTVAMLRVEEGEDREICSVCVRNISIQNRLVQLCGINLSCGGINLMHGDVCAMERDYTSMIELNLFNKKKGNKSIALWWWSGGSWVYLESLMFVS